MNRLEATFTPADFDALAARDLSQSVCVVFDILRATTSMITALANGADGVVPVVSIEEAIAEKSRRPGALLAGERHGLRITAAQSGGVDFDLGNSPREFTAEKVRGKTIITTTTNGTRALRACIQSRHVLVASFLNLRATTGWLAAARPAELMLVCGGTFDEAAYEDILAAGAVADAVWADFAGAHVTDSAQMARQLYRVASADLLAAMPFARNGRRLLADPALRDDVAFCLRRDTCDFVAELGGDGVVRRG
ncbi:MAG: 2-phosphosulfolactate phosphatase [Pedosphaera sp.]|nr:2-phosphosulfolactate phosphatase [Pedosphaera sp.]MSU43133.1 2-phosphosulfolactate phosphatase [Pedosphaera sp.]